MKEPVSDRGALLKKAVDNGPKDQIEKIRKLETQIKELENAGLAVRRSYSLTPGLSTDVKSVTNR